MQMNAVRLAGRIRSPSYSESSRSRAPAYEFISIPCPERALSNLVMDSLSIVSQSLNLICCLHSVTR